MPEKILVVDEQLFMLRLIQHTLEKAGYELIQARNAEEARAAMANEIPKLVVADAKTESQVLKELNQQHTIPVICMSDVPAGMARSATPTEVTLTKPFSPTKLVAEVKRLMPRPSPGGA